MSAHVATPDMLVLGRESRGYSPGELADAAGLSQAYISKGENGIIEVAGERLDAIARALEYPTDFFVQEERRAGIHALFHRRLRSVKATELKRIQAQMNLTRIQVKRLMHGVTIEAPHSFPRLDVDEVGGLERAAQLVR
jgi:transcriptional regulator with XRE-family HTH domain